MLSRACWWRSRSDSFIHGPLLFRQALRCSVPRAVVIRSPWSGPSAVALECCYPPSSQFSAGGHRHGEEFRNSGHRGPVSGHPAPDAADPASERAITAPDDHVPRLTPWKGPPPGKSDGGRRRRAASILLYQTQSRRSQPRCRTITGHGCVNGKERPRGSGGRSCNPATGPAGTGVRYPAPSSSFRRTARDRHPATSDASDRDEGWESR
jgi:hypothetical protein